MSTQKHAVWLILAGLSWASRAQAQCPEWVPRFAKAQLNNTVSALAAHDDGSGSALVVGGGFFGPYDADHHLDRVASWSGTAWNDLAGGLPGSVSALEVLDLGSGAHVVAGGEFIYGSLDDPRNYLAWWNAGQWEHFGESVEGPVRALAAWDDGSGIALYVGGQFTSTNTVLANHIARRSANGTWSALGSGLDGVVHALAVHDDGSGARLYAGGSFTVAGGQSALNVARWDGANWSPVGGGTNDSVRALTTFQGQLVAGGDFTTAGGVAAEHVARWDGVAWLSLTTGTNSTVHALREHDDGSGTQLFVAGDFSSAGGVTSGAVARWNGTAWSSTDTGITGSARALRAWDDGHETQLYVGGQCRLTTGDAPLNLLRWDGARWSSITPGLARASIPSSTSPLWSGDVARFDDGTGSKMFVGGRFSDAGGQAVANFARWEGDHWTSVGGTNPDGAIGRMRVLDDGTGPALFVSGNFTHVEGQPAHNFARYDAAGWHGMFLFGAPGYISDIEVADLGAGRRIYAGGGLSPNVSVLGPTAWTPIPGLNGDVYALQTFDDGSGTALYAAGSFGGTGLWGRNIARWNGTSWTSLTSNHTADIGSSLVSVRDLLVRHDSSGPRLHALFSFLQSSAPMHAVRRWEPATSTWAPVGDVQSDGGAVRLAEFDDGSGAGSRLYQLTTSRVLRLDASTWVEAAAISPVSGYGAWGLATFEQPASAVRELWITGMFSAVGGVDAGRIAVLASCASTGRPYCFGDGSGTACPCGNDSQPSERAGCVNFTGQGGALSARGQASLSNGTLTLDARHLTPMPTTLLFQGSQMVQGGSGVAFGDGLRCAGGTIRRLRTRSAVNGTVSFGHGIANDPTLAQLGGIVLAGTSAHYQLRYRDVQAFCTTDAFNLTNAVEVLWQP